MKIVPVKARTANLILPFALFGFLAPIATYLVAVSNLSTNGKTVILSVLAGSYALLFVISFQRLRATVIESARQTGETNAEEQLSSDGDVLSTEDASHRDIITGLANERGFALVLERELAECLRNPDERTMSLLLVEIGDFEMLSERYGRDSVDGVLVLAADKINNSVRGMDFAALMDNNEFSVLLPTAGVSGASETAKRIEKAFAQDVFETPTGDKVPIAVFIGQATFPNDGETKESLMARAASLKLEAKLRSHRSPTEPAGEYVN